MTETDGVGAVTETVLGTIPGEASDLPEQPNEVPQAAVQTEAAFLMYLDDNGHWVADNAVTKVLQVARESNFNDFYHAASVLKKDIEVQEQANRTVLLQQQVAQQMAEQVRTRQLAEQMGGPVGMGLREGPGGLLTPQ